jgi:hypothetical protein
MDNKQWNDNLFWIDEAPESQKLINLVSDGSFENGVTGWMSANAEGNITQAAVMSPSHNEYGSYCLMYNHTANTFANNHRVHLANFSYLENHKYYVRAQFYPTDTSIANSAIQTFIAGNTSGIEYNIAVKSTLGSPPLTRNVWNLLDGIYTPPSPVNPNVNYLQLMIVMLGAKQNTTPSYFDNVVALDLTESYGAGNEPDLATIRQIVNDNNGYFDEIKL